MHRSALILLIWLPGAVLFAQQGEPLRVFEPYRPVLMAVDTPFVDTLRAELPRRPGHVEYRASPAIDRLMADYSERKLPMQGYRVQIFLGERKAAEETKRAFLQKSPEVPAYLSWLAPNFRLRVGDLRTRLEAEKLLHELRPAFPGSYIVPDEIEMQRSAH
ncbi:MAG: SPOR domain-containing protein [Flavobacteriales bacterium]|nr:SPOR domain-containing protein [Flavobacteriales bacterium]